MKFEIITNRCKGSHDTRKHKRVANRVVKTVQVTHRAYKVLLGKNGPDTKPNKRLYRLSLTAASRWH